MTMMVVLIVWHMPVMVWNVVVAGMEVVYPFSPESLDLVGTNASKVGKRAPSYKSALLNVRPFLIV
jgi:hypothetical protein